MGCVKSKQIAEPEAVIGIGRSERLQRHANSSKLKDRPVKHPVKAKGKESNRKSKKQTLEEEMTASIRTRQNGQLPPPDLERSGRLTEREVRSRRVTSDRNETTAIFFNRPVDSFVENVQDPPQSRSKLIIEYAFASQRGYYPNDPHKPNQDAFSIHHNFGGIEEDSLFAIYDGHGPVGEHFAKYAQKNVPALYEKYLRQQRARLHKERNDSLPPGKPKIPFNPKLWPKIISPEDYQAASATGHIECNQKMIDTQPLVNLSGTTAISAAFHNGNLIISNVGDSRAILGYQNEEGGAPPETESGERPLNLLAVPLSVDQTPWRKDERERIIKAGGRVMNLDQMESQGTTPESGDGIGNVDDNITAPFGDRILGANGDIDEEGDPPRIWLPNKNIPGTSFTRSLGDSIANRVGVTGEPETFTKQITKEDQCLVLASDGVFEFLPNQDIIDICAENYGNPLEACNKIIDTSFSKWLEYEDRTDDITVIVLFMRHDLSE